MFFHVRDLAVRAGHFDVELGPGQIEFLDPKLRQSGPLKATGKVELVTGSLGEIRVKGHKDMIVRARKGYYAPKL